MTRRGRSLTGALSPLFLLVALAAGCGGGDDTADAAAFDGSGPGGFVVTPPDIPWLEEGVPPLALAPCPDGWREVTDEGGVTTCDPYPEGGALDCPDGEAHFPGEPGCMPVGAPCPAGDFSEALPADTNIVYVQPGASGDGSSPASAYGSLTSFSFVGLPTGTVIALSRGTHTGPVRLVRSVILQGACAGDTTLTATEPHDNDGVVTVRDARGEVRDLTIADSPRLGVRVVGTGAAIVLEGVVVARNQGVGLYSGDGGQLTGRSVLVRDTRGRDGINGRGLNVQFAAAELERAVLERNREAGVFVGGDSTTATLTDVMVRDTQGREADAALGRGLAMQGGAVVEARRTVFEGNHEAGVSLGDAGALARLSDAIIRDTRSQMLDGALGRGLNLQSGARAELSRVLVEGNRDVGVYAALEGSTVTLSNVVVRDTSGQESDGVSGRAINIELGAMADVSHTLLERNREIGILAKDPGTALSLSDVVVRDTDSQESNGAGGRGLNVQTGASVVASRVVLERSRNIGVMIAAGGTTATLADVIVRDIESEARNDTGGRGLNVQQDVTADVSRVVVERSSEVGVIVLGEGAAATLVDVEVRDTRPRECAETTCPDTAGGTGVASVESATVSMTGFAILRSPLCGIQLARDGQLDLSDGEVRESAIGVCLQVDPYDIERLTTGVRFIDNTLNLEATTLPTPDAALPAL